MGQRKGREVFVVTHEDQNIVIHESDEKHFALIGHAYNPFEFEIDENVLLRSLAECWSSGHETFKQALNEITGTFLLLIRTPDALFAVQDASGLKACFYGQITNQVYISSHPQLVADITGLTTDPFIEKLVSSKMYNVGNRHLPGNMSPFKELKRLGGNTYLELDHHGFKVHRFFPTSSPDAVHSSGEVTKTVAQLAEILTNSIKAVSMKWRRPALSLTGGTDSRTSLAAASECYEDLKLFSFDSKASEKLDSSVAADICEALGLPHTLYSIPQSNESVPNFELNKKIINHNSNYYKNMADNEIRKMIYLEERDEFDVEIKSWSSEIVRVFMERKYEVRLPTRLTPRHFSIFQTRFFGTPRLLRKTDKIYEEFIDELQFNEASTFYEASDLYYWEVRLGAWGSSVISAFDFCHEVTVPYNNRRFLEIFMTLPRDMRKKDAAHFEIIKLKQPKILSASRGVENRYFHSYRKIIEKAYYLYRTGTYSLKRRLLPDWRN